MVDGRHQAATGGRVPADNPRCVLELPRPPLAMFALPVPNVGWAEPGARARNVAMRARPGEKLANNLRRPQMALRLGANLVCSNVLGPKPHARSRPKPPVQTSNKAVDQEP